MSKTKIEVTAAFVTEFPSYTITGPIYTEPTEQAAWDLFAAEAMAREMDYCIGSKLETYSETVASNSARHADAMILERRKRMEGD